MGLWPNTAGYRVGPMAPTARAAAAHDARDLAFKRTAKRPRSDREAPGWSTEPSMSSLRRHRAAPERVEIRAAPDGGGGACLRPRLGFDLNAHNRRRCPARRTAREGSSTAT